MILSFIDVDVSSFSSVHRNVSPPLQKPQQWKASNYRHVFHPSSSSSSSGSTILRGLLDEMNSDAYNLMSTNSDADDKIDLHNAYEMLLAELVFSTNDPRIDIMNRFDLATDPVFLKWMLEQKIETSKDPEERLALKDLFDMIMDIKTRVDVNRLQEERLAKEAMEKEQARMADAEVTAETGRTMSNADVIKRAQQIQNADMIDPNSSSNASDKDSSEAPSKRTSFYEAD